jgi:superfamily I DNA/RNA helicase
MIRKIFGPPGTGKTTHLVGEIRKATERYDPSEIMVASFTRGAAKELVSRDLPVPDCNVGTLHALCWRSQGKPKIAESRIKDFNEQYPDYAITFDNGVDPDDPNSGVVMGGGGNALMHEFQVLRARMVPENHWGQEVIGFAGAWREWCKRNDLIDFTSLIEDALELYPVAPGSPRIAFIDEAQDFTRLEMALVMRWAESMEQVILVGDDDQAIYGFKGGDNKTFLHGPADHKDFLKYSWRLPSAIVRKATQWVEQIDDREPKIIEPCREGGYVEYHSANYRQGDMIADICEQYTEKGKTVMLLTSCSYMLDPIKAALYERGIPWHNPYRVKRGDWNPMRRSTEGRKTALGRLMDYFMLGDKEPDVRKWAKLARNASGPVYFDEAGYPLWSVDEFKSWMEVLTVAHIEERRSKKHLKKQLAMLCDPEITKDKDQMWHPYYQNRVPPFMRDYMNSTARDWLRFDVADGKADAFETYLLKSKADAFKFPLNVLRKRGVAALAEKPKVIIGTIHSVKGGEADVVVLFPDLSPVSMNGYMCDGEERDDIIRQFYVGMTRSKDTLILCSPGGHNAVVWT